MGKLTVWGYLAVISSLTVLSNYVQAQQVQQPSRTEPSASEFSDDAIFPLQTPAKEECTVKVVDGIITQCCAKPYNPVTHNCVHYTIDFIAACKEKKLRCVPVTISCVGQFNHSIVLVWLDEPEGWALVDPQGRIVRVGPVSGYEIPREKICEIMDVPTKDCQCDYFPRIEPDLPVNDPKYCFKSSPERKDCKKCCAAVISTCLSQADTDEEQAECKALEQTCIKNCDGLEDPAPPGSCTRVSGTSKEMCKACCRAHPVLKTPGLTDDDKQAWIAECKRACESSDLGPGFSPSICHQKTIKKDPPKTVEVCNRCCGFFGSRPACETDSSLGCRAWRKLCEAECLKP